MRRLIRPIALCVFLALASVPAGSLACEWSCTQKQTQTATHHHRHPTATSQEVRSDVGDAFLTATGVLCDHAFTNSPAIWVSASHIKTVLSFALPTLGWVPVRAPAGAVGTAFLSRDKSPPSLSRLLSGLRI